MKTAIVCVVSAVCGLAVAGCGAKAQLYRAETEAGAPVYEQTAVMELTNYVSRVVTNRFTVGGKAGVVFHVGDTAFARQHGLVAKDLRDEEWRIKSFGVDVVLVGGGTRGTIYAVSHFLEDRLDVHWWSEGTDYVPAAHTVDLPALDDGGKPCFLERDIFPAVGTDGNVRSNATRTAVLNRLNGGSIERPDYGGSFRWGPPSFVHSFGYYIPWDKLKDTRPEWFSLYGGKRIGGIISGQLCLEAPGLQDEMYRKLREYIAKGDEAADRAGLPRPRLYDLSMNDSQNGCQCEKCKAAVAKHGWSGQLLRFLNPLAKKIAKERPEIYLTTLAYHYTESPPKDDTKAADNLIIRLCDTRSSMAGSLKEKGNTALYDNLVGWSKCAKNIFIWDYAICYSFADTPNGVTFPVASERHFPDLFRTCRDHGVTGFFVEQENRHVGDFDALKHFLQAKLMENPDDDAEKLTRLFMSRYYGAAADLIYGYRADLERLRKERGGFVTWDPGLAPFNFIEDADIARYQELFDKAEALVADDPVRFARVRHARNGLDSLAVHRARVQVVYHGPETARPDAAASLQRLRTDWPKWFASDGSKVYGATENKKIMSVTNDLPKTAPVKLPPPPEFAGRRFYDFYPEDIYRPAAPQGSLVDDPDSPSGKASRMNTDKDPSNHWGLPFVVGYYNLTGRGIAGVTGLDKPKGKGYHWYKFQTGVMPTSEWIYMTKGWHLGLRKGLSALAGKTLETWVSVKFEGPRYYPDDPSEKGKENAISIGRMIFAEPK